MVTDNKGQIRDIVLRTERLASAAYLVSGYLPDAEPIKWGLRARVIELAMLASAANPQFVPARALQIIDEIVLHLNLALLNPGVSEMNFSLLRQEYLNLRQSLEVYKTNFTLPPAELPKIEAGKTQEIRPEVAKEIIKDKRPVSPPVTSTRRDLILRYIRSASAAPSIKDIAQAIPGVSTKTVQRELADLVTTGVLIKEGDRRWSRYSVA